MSQEKMREEFENELLGMLRANHPEMGVGLNEIVNHRSGSEYESSMFSMAWWAWQASRTAVVLELPQEQNGWSPDECAEANGFNDCLNLCVSAIESAGLRLKP